MSATKKKAPKKDSVKGTEAVPPAEDQNDRGSGKLAPAPAAPAEPKKSAASEEAKAILSEIVWAIEEIAFEQARSPASGSGWLEGFYNRLKPFHIKHGIKSNHFTIRELM